MEKTVNIGIVAHVDAGKTSLTERLLHHAGVIAEVGRVDSGSTQTDSLDLERRRGITIRSAVATFDIGDVTVNLIDTPGHADFVSEVERALSVLDGVVLVLSAVEGVQAHTRMLMRTITAMNLPVIVFINKIDRMGARDDGLLDEMRRDLSGSLAVLTTATGTGGRSAAVHDRDLADPRVAAEYAELLADHDDAFTDRYLSGDATAADLAAALAAAARRGLVYPVLCGSAATGAGIAGLAAAVTRYFPAITRQDAEPLRGTVFKIDHGWAGEKLGYVRVHSGRMAARDTVEYHRSDRDGIVTDTGRLTAVEVFRAGARPETGEARSGDIATVTGLKRLRIGDRIGTMDGFGTVRRFPAPKLEAVVTPVYQRDRARLFEALTRLADADPFIGVRSDPDGELSVRLYGQVQQEVLAANLADEHGVPVEFAPLRVVCVERPAGVGEAVQFMSEQDPMYFFATIGLRVEPGEPGSGVGYGMSVELGALPRAFHQAIADTVHKTLHQGLYGWEVTDVRVTLTHSGYSSPLSTAADFRNLTPLVLAEALRRAGVRVHEPVDHFDIDLPVDSLSDVLRGLVAAGAQPGPPAITGGRCRIDGTIPARELDDFTRELPGLTRGEGLITTRPGGTAAVTGPPPRRRRTDANPFHRDEYLLAVLKKRG